MSSVKGMRQAVAAGVLGALAVAETLTRTHDGPSAALSAVIALAVVAPLALLRFWPVIAAGLSALAVLSGLFTSHPGTLASLATLATLYGIVGNRRPLWMAAAIVLPFAGYAAMSLSSDRPGGKPGAFVLLAVTASAALTGAALRLRDERRRHRATERSAAESLMQYAARGERARIARELHDVVAHHITMIALQAETARLATPGMPAEGARRLTAIGDTARTALIEMRRLLGVLRADVDTGAEPALRPQPGLRQLNTLLDEVRDTAGGSLRLIVSGRVGPLDPGIELTAYRIVQEALTNARRHAPGAAVDVALHYGGDDLVLRVYDNGPGPAPETGDGLGLAGMRERAATAGGRLTAGAAPGTGFLVHAVLPAKACAP